MFPLTVHSMLPMLSRALLLGIAAGLLSGAGAFSRECERKTRIDPDLPRPVALYDDDGRGYTTYVLICEQSDVLCYLNRNASERYERLQQRFCDRALAGCLQTLLPRGELTECPQVGECFDGPARGEYLVPFSGARVFWPKGPGFNASADAWLNLDGCDVTALPAGELRNAPALRTVDLARNRISHIGADAFAGPPLQKITVVLNAVELTIGSGAFANLPHLEILVISDSRVQSMAPDALHNSSRIRLLRLDRNRLRRLPAELLRGQAALDSLDLGDNRLEELPQLLLREAPLLAFLRLNGNRLRDLPPTLFANSTRLRAVDLSRNRLQNLPEGIFSGLQSLRYIRLQDNHLHHFPPSAFRGLAIEDLDMSGNRLELAVEIDWPVSLTHLRLARNRITSVAAAWTLLPGLRILNLADNNISRLHVTTSEYASPRLEVDLRHNRIGSLALEGANAPSEDTHPRVLFLLAANPLNCSCELLSMCPRDQRCSFAAKATGVQCSARAELKCRGEAPEGPYLSTGPFSATDTSDSANPGETTLPTLTSSSTLPPWPFSDYYY